MKKLFILASAASIIFSACDRINPETLPGKKKHNDTTGATTSTTEGVTTSNTSSGSTVFGVTTSGSTTSSTSSVTNGCSAMVTNLFAGQHNLAGNVSVTNDETNLYITFNTQDGWVLNHTHVYAGPLSGLPKGANGNPKIGNFPYQAPHNPNVTSYTYTIPLSSVSADDCFIIATHAEVLRNSADGQTQQAETAWGAGTQITPGGSWASYFNYCKCENTSGTTTGTTTSGSTTSETTGGTTTSGTTTSGSTTSGTTSGSTTSSTTSGSTTESNTTSGSSTSGSTTDIVVEN
jgi:hypothetical protein